MEPRVALAGGLAFFNRGSRIVAFDIDRGRELWSTEGSLGWQPALEGAWMRGDALYIKIHGGMARFEPGTGALLWKTERIKNWVFNKGRDHVKIPGLLAPGIF